MLLLALVNFALGFIPPIDSISVVNWIASGLCVVFWYIDEE